MNTQIVLISFEEIRRVWSQDLWPQRLSKIEPVSWIDQMGEIDMNLAIGPPTFLGCFDERHNLLGVLSGFKTGKRYYRTRGLWVYPEFRRRSVARTMMDYLDSCATREGCEILWTMPRYSAWDFYERIKFTKVKVVEKYENGPHYLAQRQLKMVNTSSLGLFRPNS